MAQQISESELVLIENSFCENGMAAFYTPHHGGIGKRTKNEWKNNTVLTLLVPSCGEKSSEVKKNQAEE